MSRRPPLHLVFSLSMLALAACGEDRSPTQPESGVEPAPSAPQFALASNTWTLKAAYPAVFGAVWLSAGVARNAAGQSIVYTFGGTDDQGGLGVPIVAYNVGTNTWTSKGKETEIQFFNMNGVGEIGGKLYVSGGSAGDFYGFTSATWEYDPAANRLSLKANMPKLTADGVSGVIDGKLYVLPGRCLDWFWPQAGYCEHEPFRRLFRYNPATNYWATKRPAPHYHAHGAGGVINGKFYVAGGTESGVPVAALDRYDPVTDTWTTLAPLPTAGRARGAVLQGKLFVVVSPDGAPDRAYAYNPATNTWTSKAAPRRPHDAIVAITWGGKPYLLAIGGIHQVSTWPYTVANASELYTP